MERKLKLEKRIRNAKTNIFRIVTIFSRCMHILKLYGMASSGLSSRCSIESISKNQKNVQHIHLHPKPVLCREIRETGNRRMLAMGVIETAQTEWAPQIVFVPRTQGTIHFCVNYRKLNGVPIRSWYSIQHIERCIHSLGETMIFSSLNAKKLILAGLNRRRRS